MLCFYQVISHPIFYVIWWDYGYIPLDDYPTVWHIVGIEKELFMTTARVHTVHPDTKGRIALGSLAKGISSFQISTDK